MFNEGRQIVLQLLQAQFGHTATLAGLAISPGGAVTMVMMMVVGRHEFVPPRYLIAAGSAIACYAMIDLLRISSNGMRLPTARRRKPAR